MTVPTVERGLRFTVFWSMHNVGEMPSTDQFSRLQISQFFLELTACDGANAPIIVEGSFNVKLQRGLREACPLD